MEFPGLENLLIPESGVEGYFVVGLADVLGQRAKLLAYDDPPPDGLKNREKREQLRMETLEVVRAFRKDFHDQFQSYQRYIANSPLNLIGGPVREQLDSLDSAPVSVQTISDLIALSLRLANRKGIVTLEGVFLMLASFGMSSLCSLYRGQPIRGGIELDGAWPIERNGMQSEIYGQALAKAYCLESEVAGYPRIVVGKNLLAFIELNRNLPETDLNPINRANRTYADLTRRLLVTDDDGETVINPFSTFFRDLDPNRMRTMTERSLDFARTEQRRFEAAGDTKLATRYARLVNFIERHGTA